MSNPGLPAYFPALAAALRHAARLLLCAILHPRQVRRLRLGLRCFRCDPWRRRGDAAMPQDLPQDQLELELNESEQIRTEENSVGKEPANETGE